MLAIMTRELSMNRFFSVWASLAFAGALLISGCGGFSGDSSETANAASRKDPQPAPDFKLADVEGRELKLSDFKGQVVLLNFWATWCGPCKIEMPWFIDFQRKYKDQGFTVLAVSLDDGWEPVRPFVKEFKLNFPVVLGDDDVADSFGGIAALPTTLIIDKDGVIVSRHTGLVSRSEYERDIEGLL